MIIINFNLLHDKNKESIWIIAIVYLNISWIYQFLGHCIFCIRSEPSTITSFVAYPIGLMTTIHGACLHPHAQATISMRFKWKHDQNFCAAQEKLRERLQEHHSGTLGVRHIGAASQVSPNPSFPVKGMESPRSVWWSFIPSTWGMNPLMMDSDRTYMKKPFIYSLVLICPV